MSTSHSSPPYHITALELRPPPNSPSVSCVSIFQDNQSDDGDIGSGNGGCNFYVAYTTQPSSTGVGPVLHIRTYSHPLNNNNNNNNTSNSKSSNPFADDDYESESGMDGSVEPLSSTSNAPNAKDTYVSVKVPTKHAVVNINVSGGGGGWMMLLTDTDDTMFLYSNDEIKAINANDHGKAAISDYRGTDGFLGCSLLNGGGLYDILNARTTRQRHWPTKFKLENKVISLNQVGLSGNIAVVCCEDGGVYCIGSKLSRFYDERGDCVRLFDFSNSGDRDGGGGGGDVIVIDVTPPTHTHSKSNPKSPPSSQEKTRVLLTHQKTIAIVTIKHTPSTGVLATIPSSTSPSTPNMNITTLKTAIEVIDATAYLSAASGRQLLALLLSPSSSSSSSRSGSIASNFIDVRDSNALNVILVTIQLDANTSFTNLFTISSSTSNPNGRLFTVSTVPASTSRSSSVSRGNNGNKESEARLITIPALDTTKLQHERVFNMCIDLFCRTSTSTSTDAAAAATFVFPRNEVAECFELSFIAASYQSDTATIPTSVSVSVSVGVDELIDYLCCIIGIDQNDTSDDEGNDNENSREVSTAVYALLCYTCFHAYTSNHSSPESKSKSKSKSILSSICLKSARLSSNSTVQNQHSRRESACSRLCFVLSSYISSSSDSDGSTWIQSVTWLLRTSGEHNDALDLMNSGLLITADDVLLAEYLQNLYSSDNLGLARLALTHLPNLMQRNPVLGLNVLSSANSKDPMQHLINPIEVVGVLKDVIVHVGNTVVGGEGLPLTSGNAIACAFLFSVIGVDSKTQSTRSTSLSTTTTTSTNPFNDDDDSDRDIEAIHNQLCYLLLEGVFGETNPNSSASSENETEACKKYRLNLHKFLKSPKARYNPSDIMCFLPKSYVYERVVLLGRQGLFDEGLTLLYLDTIGGRGSGGRLNVCLEYCDYIYTSTDESSSSSQIECIYCTLIKVLLINDQTNLNAITIMQKREHVLSQSLALTLLPPSTPLNSVKPFISDCMQHGDSNVRQLTVVSNIVRRRFIELQFELTVARLKAHLNISNVNALKSSSSLKLDGVISVSDKITLNNINHRAGIFPFTVSVIKRMYRRHIVLQTFITNNTPSTTYDSISIEIPEISSDSLSVIYIDTDTSADGLSIKSLPGGCTGCCYVVFKRDGANNSSKNNNNANNGKIVITTEIHYYSGGNSSDNLLLSNRNNGVGSGSGSGGGKMNVEEVEGVVFSFEELRTR